MAELFQKAKSTINHHILSIFEEKELDASECMRKFENIEFSTKPENYYNLDVIISVGYRVKSRRGTEKNKTITAAGTKRTIPAQTKLDILMTGYLSIKEDVLAKIEAHMPEIRERFCIEDLSLFGSVARGEDTPDSDIDILYTFLPGETTLEHLEDLQTYLETLFDRKIDLISKKWLNPYFRTTVLNEAVSL